MLKRTLLIDQNSVAFLSPEQVERVRRFSLLRDYLARKDEELLRWNESKVGRGDDAVNARRITNIGTFRAYVLAYLKAHEQIAKNMTLLVRQLDPGPTGLPLEIYCFTNTTNWSAYEDIQSNIFDHMLAIMPEFGLRIYQEPSGLDLQRLVNSPA